MGDALVLHPGVIAEINIAAPGELPAPVERRVDGDPISAA